MPRCFEELVVGEVYESATRVIADADVRAFAELTGDRSDIHLDDDIARASKYGRRIAHGALIFSTSIGLLVSDDERKPEIIALLGVDKLRFAQPVFPGDVVRVRQTIKSLDVVGTEAGRIESAIEVLNGSNVTTVRYTASFLVRRRPSQSGNSG